MGAGSLALLRSRRSSLVKRAEPVYFRVASWLLQRCKQACLRTGLAVRLGLLCWKDHLVKKWLEKSVLCIP